MGQYYKIVNITKKEFILPWTFNDGDKLTEIMVNGGSLSALAVLLSNGNNRGMGDLHSDLDIIGSWSGDRIVVAGDYGDTGLFLPKKQRTENLYNVAGDEYKDVSIAVLVALMADEYIFNNLRLSKDVVHNIAILYKTPPEDYPTIIEHIGDEYKGYVADVLRNLKVTNES